MLVALAKIVHNQNYTYPEAPFQNGCRVVFSELNLNSINEQFIELGRVCSTADIVDDRKVSLSKFKVLFISHDKKLLAVCTLRGTVTLRRYWYYVIGMRGINNINMNTGECMIGTVDIPGDVNALPKGITYPIGIALVRNPKESVLKSLNLLTDGKNYFETQITDPMFETIRFNLQDFYVVGSATPFTFCEYFHKLYPSYERQRNSFLRDWEGTLNTVDRSLNRCVPHTRKDLISFPMQPEYVVSSFTTPGRDNNCREGFKLPAQQQSSKRRKLQVASCISEFETEDEAIVFMDTSDAYQNVINNHANTVAHDHNYAANEEDIFKPHQVDKVIFENNLNELAPFIWGDCSRYMSLMQLQGLPFNPFDASTIVNSTVCQWIEYLSTTNKLRCKWCNMLLNQKILVDRSGSPFVTDIMKLGTGRINVNNTISASKVRTANRKKLTDHINNKFHKMAEDFFRLHDSGLRGKELMDEFEKPGGTYRNFFKATENVAVLAIQSLRMGISFRSYKIMTDTINYLGAKIGHLYQTESSLNTLANALGTYLHHNLTNYLLKFQPEVSVTLDSTTDVSGRSVLAIVLHTLKEDGSVWVVLYRVIKIRSESGQALFDTFINCLEEDGLTTYIKEKLIGLTTDGHPALRSIFRRLLDEFVNNKLVSIHCIAHRIELVSAKSFERFDYLGEVDNLINDIFAFLTKKSSKRREIFRKFTAELGFRLFEVKRVRKFRWVGHHYRALEPLIQRFKVLVMTFDSIYNDESFPMTDRSRAQNLLNSLKSPTLLATIAFTADVVSGLKRLSESLQKFGDSIIGKKLLRDKLIDYLKSFETKNGEMVTYIMKNSKTFLTNETIVDMDMLQDHNVVFDRVVMNQPNKLYDNMKLSVRRNSYIIDLITEIESRFPEDVHDQFDFLHPSRFPDSAYADYYGIGQLQFLNTNLSWGYDNEQLAVDWINLLESVKMNPDYEKFKGESAEKFWSRFMTNTENVKWSNAMTEIVRKALTIPATSVQNERIFSMYAYTKTLGRFNLLVSTVENILRVLFNGPNEIEMWSTFEVAKGLLQYMSRPDDLSRRSTWKSTKDSIDFVSFNDVTSVDEDAVDEGDTE